MFNKEVKLNLKCQMQFQLEQVLFLKNEQQKKTAKLNLRVVLILILSAKGQKEHIFAKELHSPDTFSAMKFRFLILEIKHNLSTMFEYFCLKMAFLTKNFFGS